MSLLAEAVAVLEADGIAHALIGAAALAVHGVSRSTADIDLLTVDLRSLRTEPWAGFEGHGSVRVLRGDFDDPLAGSVRLVRAEEIVDVVVGRWAWQAEIIEAAERTPLGELTLPVVRPAGLVLLKLLAGGPKDAWDIRALLEVVADATTLKLDVESVLPRLPADARRLWQRVTA